MKKHFYNLKFLSLLLAIFNSASLFLLLSFIGVSTNINLILSLPLGVMVGLFVYGILEFVVNKKIKNIYKIILHTKADKQEKIYLDNLEPKKNLLDVEKNVKSWAEKENEDLDFYKKLSQFKKEFLQNISHELRTPLFVIQAYAENFKQTINQDKKHKDYQEIIDVILRNTNRLNLFLNDITTLSLIETNQIQLYQEDFYLEDLINEVLQDLYFLINEKEIVVKKEFTNDKHLIFADRNKIKQVLNNIINNAVQHNLEKTEIYFQFQKIDDTTLLFEISDTGKGIEEVHVERVFERFYRADSHRNRSSGGSGLGLAICKHIMELHQSLIHVRSKVGVGTTFTIGLALAK